MDGVYEKPHNSIARVPNNKKREKNHIDMNSLPRKKAKMTAGQEFEDSDDNGDVKTEIDDQEQTLLSLIEHRTKEVERMKWRVLHYTAEVYYLLFVYILYVYFCF